MSKQVRPAGAFQNSPIVQHGQITSERHNSTGRKSRADSPIPFRLARPGIRAVRASVATGHLFEDEPSADGVVVPDAERDVPKEWRVA
ncbi:MAG: hypothetical protein HOW73_47805 [Polyangiaceae bacterium]|nr:hypothetical protein [Polyangiaceae bacterium]